MSRGSFALAVAALALVVLGAVAVFSTTNGAGAAALVAVGGLGIATAMGWRRVTSLGFGGAEITFRTAADLLERSANAESRGEADAAAQLRAEAWDLLRVARPLASSYESVREALPKGPARTRALEAIVSAAQLVAADFTAQEQVAALFDAGSAGNRILALATMEVRPDLVTTRLVVAAIEAPESAFEQYHALRVALRCAPVIDPESARILAAAIERQVGHAFGHDGDRGALADAALAVLLLRTG